MTKKYEIAAYYFPNYHQDERNEVWHGKGWNEWELVKGASPRFEGHAQPKVPLWGYEDESDPEVMEKKISAAEENGVDAFIFDWYWHDEGPFLMKALDNGFLKAKNIDKLKFSIMWANHDWMEIQPANRCKPYNIRAQGPVSEKTFVEATEHIINTYFKHPSYWRVNGGLYFSVYELMSLVKGFGGVDNTKLMLEDFRDRVRRQGLGELHLNAVIWGVQILPGEEKITNGNELLKELGFDSVTSYVWIHHNEMPDFPFTDYAKFRDISINEFQKLTDEYDLPYYPNVTMGWDPSPRTIQSDRYDNLGYPFTPILVRNTPDEFRKALEQTKVFLNNGPLSTKILTINAWNEWTEGSYLEPDAVNGLKYLEAVKNVFKDSK